MAMIEQFNDPDFNPEIFTQTLGDRIMLTSGKKWSIVEDAATLTDASRQTTNLDWHVDGLYYKTVPRYVLLHCTEPGKGGVKTEFVDTYYVTNKLPGDVALILSKLQMHYIGKDGEYQHYPILSLSGLNLGSRGYVSPKSHALEEMPTNREIAKAMVCLFETMDVNVCLSKSWIKGDTVIFDQTRIIHRRVSTLSDRERKLIRMWWN
jgi:alpha-ketoglutarate-dependent taurine dioxygenase